MAITAHCDDHVDDLWELRTCPLCTIASKDARIAALEAALAKAEEALEESGDIYGSHFIGDGCSCVKCRGLRRKAALAAIREVKP